MSYRDTLEEWAEPAGNWPVSSLTKREAFRDGYIDAMVWANVCPAKDGIETEADGSELSDQAVKILTDQADDFLDETTVPLIERACEVEGYDYGHAGHDFALTRNHHGAGFWDRGLPDTVGEDLTEIAHGYGDAYIFAGTSDPAKWEVG